jgi:amidase
MLVAVLTFSACRSKEREIPPESPPPPVTVPAPAPERLPANTARLRELEFNSFQPALNAWAQKAAARETALTALLQESTVLQVQEALDAGELTSENLTLYFLNRIRREDGRLRSYIELNPLCLEEARASDRRRGAGERRGPLDGIPVSVKDNIDTAAPLHTTAGSEILLHHSPARDAAVVTRLREAGAVILGKASLSELAGALTTNPPGFNAVSGFGRHPSGRPFPVSGSSSGSAIATRAGLAFMSVGTETSGSLLAPAAANGVVAMKPSLGRVSGEGIVPLIRFQDSAGPVARTVTDAAVLLGVLAGAEAGILNGHAFAPAGDLFNPDALAGVTVGVLREDLLDTPAGEAWLKRIDDKLRRARAIPRDVVLVKKSATEEGESNRGPDGVETEALGDVDVEAQLTPLIFLGLDQETLPYLVAAGAPVKTLAELEAYHAARPEIRIPQGQNVLSYAVQWQAALRRAGLGSKAVPGLRKGTEGEEGEAASLGAVYERLALDLRHAASRMLDRAFEERGAAVLVSLGNTHSAIYATAGYPAITVPLGESESSEPNGVTLIARRGEDARLLGFAFAME